MDKLLALKAKLVSGEITREQFETEAQTLLVTKEITQQEYENRDGSDKGGDDEKPLTRKDIEDLIEKERQIAADKVRTEYSKKLADEKKEREKLELEKMTSEQQAEFKRKQLENDLETRIKDLNAREVEIEVADQLSALQLPMSFKPFFTKAETKEDAKANVNTLAELWKTELRAAVESRLASLGDKRGGNGGGDAHVKKWTDLTLTEQGQLLAKDPAEAVALAKASGITLKL